MGFKKCLFSRTRLGLELGLGFSLRGRVRVKGWPNIYEFSARKDAFPIYCY